MEYPRIFVQAQESYCTFDTFIPAPYMRKLFYMKGSLKSAQLLICGLGFYEVWLNGTKLTKGPLSPYISAPDDWLCFDMYEVGTYLHTGENVLGVLLGNGMQNAFGGYRWEFDKAKWRNAPSVSFRLTIQTADGTQIVESDTDMRTAPSPIYFDELRCGEYYDARKEKTGWNMPGYDDSDWIPVQKAPLPRGEAAVCTADPIIVEQEIMPVSITKTENGYLYDFGINTAGVCRLHLSGESGQTISLEHGEWLDKGRLNLRNIAFVPEGFVQKDIYICAGQGEETYIPHFTYHGFQYVLVKGIRDEQALPELLTYLVMHSDLKERGNFFCSDPTANALQTLVRRSTLANFFYFPTDCPHREKNGWTGDAALSAEHTLLNLEAERSYKEWLRHVRKSQNEAGALPGIVPTGDWGYVWGNGPAWDQVIVELPFRLYQYRGDQGVLKENATAILRYVHYLSTKVNDDGLICFGLGDWCPPGRGADQYKSPLALTDSILTLDITRKASFIFDVLGMEEECLYARRLGDKLRSQIRLHLVDLHTMTAAGNCQTSQAMVLFYDVLDPGEKAQAFQVLLNIIERNNGHLDTGVLGARVLFHVLSDFGCSELAFDMITRLDYPSYGNMIARGATSLWETFYPEGGSPASLNHHFFGDISSWFIQHLAGIRLNPTGRNVHELHLRPAFISQLQHAQAHHHAPDGDIHTAWKRDGNSITFDVDIPASMTGTICLEPEYAFQDGLAFKPLQSGKYCIERRNKDV